MQRSFLREVAMRCLIAARQCYDDEAKETFVSIAEDVTRQANEAEGLIPPAAPREKAPAPLSGPFVP